MEDSQNVLNNRFQLENEINCFSEKIDGLISKKVIYEFNMTEQKKYKELIIQIKDKIDKNKLEKETISQILKEINNALPYLKKIINKPIQTKNDNLICEKCQSNCHKNCNCSFTAFSKYFCNMISFNGKCKICNHNISYHKKVKFIYIQKEESEKLINDDIEELINYTNFLLGKEKEEMFHMIAINEDNDFLQKALNNFNNQIENCDKEIEKVKTNILTIENEIYGALNNIKNNLDFLR